MPKEAISQAWVYAINLACEVSLLTGLVLYRISTHRVQSLLRQRF